MSAPASLATVLQNPAIWRGGECAPNAAAVPTRCAALDHVLPGGGWPTDALTEILLAREGIGELALTLPALVELQASRREVVWIAPPYVPYAPALAAAGLDLARFIVVRCPSSADQLWAFEQALRAPECAAAFAWPQQVDERAARRLQVAARDGRTWGVLWRRPGQQGVASAAPLRLSLSRHATGKLAIRVLKRRGGDLGQPVLADVEASLRRREPTRGSAVVAPRHAPAARSA